MQQKQKQKRVESSRVDFFKFVEWIKRQTNIPEMLPQEMVDTFHADTGVRISKSAVRDACELVGVSPKRLVKRRKRRSEFSLEDVGRHRNRFLAQVFQRFVDSLEKGLGGAVMNESDRRVLRLLATDRGVSLGTGATPTLFDAVSSEEANNG